MAICFELVVNFGENAEAGGRPRQSQSLDASGWQPPDSPPPRRDEPDWLLHRAISAAVAVGWGVGLDGTLPRTRLSAAELSELGTGLYRLLARFNGYIAAKVGWDPEGFLDPEELKSDWADELANGAISGLVLCEALHAELCLGRNYVEFQPGYLWIPYRGEKPSGLGP
jgi:hypothetical protein